MMNDRYLFRAKRIDNGEWVQGYYTYYPYGFTSVDKVEHAIRDTVSEYCSKLYFVDPSTICQCTGLKDKNGTLIWENDIVFATDDDGNSGQVDTGVGEVDFLEGLWYIGGNVQNALYDINKIHQIKVIGSIFDNPELLEQED